MADHTAAVEIDQRQVTVVGPQRDHLQRNAVAQRNAGGLGCAIGHLGQAGDQLRVERGALGRIELVQHTVGRLGRSGLSIDAAADALLHQEGRCALDGRQRVVDRDALQRQYAGGDGRVGDVKLDRVQRDVHPVEHGVGLRRLHAGQRAGDGLAVAGRIGDRQGDAVVAGGQRHVGQLEASGTTGGAEQALAGQRDRGAGLGRALQRHDAGASLGVVARQCVNAGDAEACPRGRLVVEGEDHVQRRTAVAGGVLRHQPQRVRTVAERAAGQGIKRGLVDREAAIGLQARRQIDKGGRRAAVQCREQARRSGVVQRPAGDRRIVGQTIG